MCFYGVAHRELIPESIHDISQYANNRADLSHQPTGVRERVMRRFKSMQQAQRFLTVRAAVYNLFNLGRHLVSAKNYRFSDRVHFRLGIALQHEKRFVPRGQASRWSN